MLSGACGFNIDSSDSPRKRFIQYINTEYIIIHRTGRIPGASPSFQRSVSDPHHYPFGLWHFCVSFTIQDSYIQELLSDHFGVCKWPFTGLSDLILGYQKVPLKVLDDDVVC